MGRYTKLNYGHGVSRPVLEARALPTRNWQEIVKTINASVQAGTVTLDDGVEADVREYVELGPHDPSTARERPVSLGTPKKPDGDDAA